jgi:hypothetical protein
MSGSGASPVGRRRLLAGLLAASSLAAVAGCGNGAAANGDGAAANGNGAPPSISPIPRVEKPRNINAVADRPCQLFPPQQAALFGLDRPPRQIRGTLGNNDCEWRNSKLDVWVYISTYTNKLTLEEVYARRETLPYFELTQIGGYPATVSRAEAKLPVCDVDIKPAEYQSVTVSYDSTKLNNHPEQGCVVAKRVAEAVVGNLPPST